MNIVINEDEQEALLLCSLEATRLYVLGIRPRMDIRTGLVGVVAAVANGRLGLEVQYAPSRGSQRSAWVPGAREVRCLIDELERVGLVQRQSQRSQSEKQLVLFLSLAFSGSVRVREERPMSVNEQRPYQSGVNVGFALNERPMSGSDERQISELSEKDFLLNTSSLNSVSSGAVDKSDEMTFAKNGTPLQAGGWVGLVVQMGFSQAVACHPDSAAVFRCWLRDGVTLDEVRAARAAAAAHAETVVYLAKVVATRRLQAGRGVGGKVVPLPVWSDSWPGIERRGAELGLVQGKNEHPQHFKARVFMAAGEPLPDGMLMEAM